MLVRRMPSLDFSSGVQSSTPAEFAWIQCRTFPALTTCSLQAPITASESPSSDRISVPQAPCLLTGISFTFGAADCNQAIRSGVSTLTTILRGGFQPLTISRTGLSLSCKPSFATTRASPGLPAGELVPPAASEAAPKEEAQPITRQMPH